MFVCHTSDWYFDMLYAARNLSHPCRKLGLSPFMYKYIVLHKILNWFCLTLSTSHQNLISILLDFLGFTVLFIIKFPELLYIQTGVSYGDYKCTSLISVVIIGNYSCLFVYNLPHSDSTCDTITVSIILVKMNIFP